MYHDLEKDKWRMLPWDMDKTFNPDHIDYNYQRTSWSEGISSSMNTNSLIEKFLANQNTLKSVRNRIVDLQNKPNQVPTVKYYGPLDENTEMDLELDRVTTFNPFNCFALVKECKKNLSKKKYESFKDHYNYNHAPKDFFNNNENNVEMIKSSQVIQEDLASCLHLISHTARPINIGPALVIQSQLAAL